MKLTVYIPAIDDLWFRQQMLEDDKTMSYNHAWGGAIPWPREKWGEWYDCWIEHPQRKRYYRYLREVETGAFVGEIAYHWDDDQKLCLADVIVYAPYRGRGYGREGLRLLCHAAKDNGFEALYDDIAADNPAIELFLGEGFVQVSETKMIRLLRKDLRSMQ